MILLIDNYDSFSYNLVQMIGSIDPDIRVVRNDRITIDDIKGMSPSHLVLSPGPGYPKDAGILEQAVRELKGRMPILGVCLGHQGICEAFGGTISHARKLMHGKQSSIEVNNQSPLFKGLAPRIQAARYHSLAAEEGNLPGELEIIAKDSEEGEVMAVQHREYPVYGLQFHPESILTPDGKQILGNFLSLACTA
ncbi:aminodeoxychorismate/anthranilate synthase component II [Lachnoclostridium pacaense]|uniref:anthranilate synthase component II n=1 Tax=Enterocloster hominis (ex Hitch et al. 2024) TaxID=1917870 RepID=UPI001D112C1E|nr:aminodeoxychorismate/anthranilate synthase component II [Lachnoclostridium pacaense]MCC2877155.1 aminodeoxychorismate/anthranilate synthase component II [Lachnoclostridium pacaense]